VTLTQLLYVLAVDRTRHFSRAAQECYVTQPTLSAQIKKLESELGVIIFDRSIAPVEPTEIGRRIIEQARVAVDELDRIPQLVSIAKKGVVGRLRVGLIPTLAPYLLSHFVAALHRKYPDLILEVSETTTERCLERLDEADLDVAILATPEDPKRYRQEDVFEEDMLLFVNRKHRFYDVESVRVTQLTSHDVWLLEEGHCLRDEIVKICRAVIHGEDRPKNVNLKIGSLEAVRDLVATFSGYTLLPVLSSLKLNRQQRELIRRFEGPVPYRTVNLTRRRTALHREAVAALKQAIVNNLPPVEGLRAL